jgi:hypothetical protein
MAGLDEIEDDRGGPVVDGEVIRGAPLGGGGGADGFPLPIGGGVGPLCCGGWFGNGELIIPTVIGVPLRGVCFPNPSGISFHPGRLVAVVYVVTVAGDWLDARGGGATGFAGVEVPNVWGGGPTFGTFIAFGG